MEMTYNGTLVMPKNYVVVDNNEMEYVDGGLKLSYNPCYATRIGALGKAAHLKVTRFWGKITAIDLAAEIYTHALAYYIAGGFLKILSHLGYSQSIKASVLGGIDVQNKLDTATICGIKRYELYRAVYAFVGVI